MQTNSAKKQQHTLITVVTLYSIFVTVNNNKLWPQGIK